MSAESKPYICLCIPSLGEVTIQWSKFMASIIWENFVSRALFFKPDKVGGCIAETRNSIVADVFAFAAAGNRVHSLFWLDDDVLPTEFVLLELLHCMEQTSRADICSGVYFTKMPGKASAPLLYRSNKPPVFEPDAVLDSVDDGVIGHGMGLCLIRFEVYERMLKELSLPKDRFGNTEFYRTSNVTEDMHRDASGAVSLGNTEDTNFLLNARKLDIASTVVCTNAAFGFHYEHYRWCPMCEIEYTNLFTQCTRCRGTLLMQDRGYPGEQWSQYVSGNPVKWQTPRGEVIWK